MTVVLVTIPWALIAWRANRPDHPLEVRWGAIVAANRFPPKLRIFRDYLESGYIFSYILLAIQQCSGYDHA
jgi:hypothetical protein